MYALSSCYDKISASLIRASHWGVCLALVGILYSSCAFKFSPNYSALILTQLDQIAPPLYELCYQMEQGTNSSDYKSLREAHYNALLAKMESLKLKIISRPNINPALQSTALKCYYDKLHQPNNAIHYTQLEESPSLIYLNSLIEDWKQLKISDSKRNLSTAEIEEYRHKFSYALVQIAIYENILNQ